MKTVGLITEYNPFHEGHKHHIQEAKHITGADRVVVLMSGNYVQRGEPAFFDKYLRAQIALEHGADLVLELPVLYATGSAELFAHGAVSMLHRLGLIDSICFGSESASIEQLSAIANILVTEPDTYRLTLQAALKSGNSFPTARNLAVLKHLQENPSLWSGDFSHISDILNSPNHILGIEYLKALLRLESDIKPYVIQRIEAGYHDTDHESRFYSASAIRVLQSSESLRSSLAHISSGYKAYLDTLGPIVPSDFSLILGEKLLTAKRCHTLTDFVDVTADLSNAIESNLYEYCDFDSFITKLKTKNVTYTRLSRCLLHIMLGITNNLKEALDEQQGPSFVRILGFNNHGSQLFKHISSDISLITKVANYRQQLLSDTDISLFETGLYADDMYRVVQMHKYNTLIPNEYTRKLMVVK